MLGTVCSVSLFWGVSGFLESAASCLLAVIHLTYWLAKDIYAHLAPTRTPFLPRPKNTRQNLALWHWPPTETPPTCVLAVLAPKFRGMIINLLWILGLSGAWTAGALSNNSFEIGLLFRTDIYFCLIDQQLFGRPSGNLVLDDQTTVLCGHRFEEPRSNIFVI